MDTTSAYLRVARQHEQSMLERLRQTARERVSAAAFSWLEIAVREAIHAGASYQARNLPKELRERAQLDLRTQAVSSFVQRRVSRLLDVSGLTADAEQVSLVLRPRLVAAGEVNAALFFGRHELIRQMILRGQLSPFWITREWRTARDERVRASHAALHGQVAQWGLPFVSPSSGVALMHPHDPDAPAREVVNCRCTEIIRVNLP